MSEPMDEGASGDEPREEREPTPEGSPRSSRPVPAREAVSIAFAVTIAAGAVITFAFDPGRAGQGAIVASLGALYALLGAVALVRLHRRGELRESFRRVSGDVTFGAVVAGALYGAARIILPVIAGHGSAREAWIMRLYLQIGDTAEKGRLIGLGVLVVAALEELTWRGLAMRALHDAFGARRALVYSTLLAGLAHVPTVFLLRDPTAGWNPLVLLGAVGCGLVWGAMVWRTGRMVPALVAHALFSWAVIELPLWRL